MLAVQCLLKNQNQILFKTSQNNKTILFKTYSIAELKKLVEKSLNNNQYPFRGLKINIQFGDVYIGPDATLQFDQSMPIQENFFKIVSHGRVYIKSLRCLNIIIKSKSVRFFDQNTCRQSIEFQHYEDPSDALIMQSNNVHKYCKGSFQICKDGKLSVKKLKLALGTDLLIKENSHLKLTQSPAFLKAQNSNIQISFEGKLYARKDLLILSKTIINKGYINTISQDQGIVIIHCKIINNFGEIDPNSLSIKAKELSNHSQGILRAHNGQLVVDNLFENKGQIEIPNITVWDFQQDTKIKKQAKVVNSGSISTKQLIAEVQFWSNTNTIACNKLSTNGKYDGSIMKNTGIISCGHIVITDLILLNSHNGGIVSNGHLQIYIKGWINEGEFVNNRKVYVSVDDHISNQGLLQFNQGYLNSLTLHNEKQISAKKNLHLNIRQLLVNDKGGVIKMPKLSVLTEKVRNLGAIEVKELEVRAQQIQNQKTGNITAQKAQISGKIFQNSGKAYFDQINLMASNNLNNQGQFKANNLNFNGGYINNKKKVQVNSGKIYTDLHYKDSDKAEGIFRNAVMVAKNDDKFYTEGKLEFQNVDFQKSFKHFHNTKEVSFDRVALNIDGLQVKDLKMKNTNITFTSFDQQKGGKLISKGGINSLNEGQRKSLKLSGKNNQFFINIKNEQMVKKITVICQQHNQVVIGTTNPMINGWNLLQQPIAVGDFSKKLQCAFFQIPGGVYHANIKDKKFKHGSSVDPSQYSKFSSSEIPHTGEKQLTIQTQHLMFGGKIKYSGKQLNLAAKNIELQVSCIEVPDGVMKVTAEQNVFITLSYMKAKGIEIQAQNIQCKGSKLYASASDLLLDAIKINVNPQIQRKKKTQTNGNKKTIRKWEQAMQSQFVAEGSIMIRAEQYIRMISPSIKAQNDLLISSPDTQIQGIYLYDQKQVQVKKKKTFGGSKTNVYISRNDRPLPAFLDAQNIIIQGKAKINADFKAKKLIDLTDQGLHLFYAIGYKGKCENREFSNFCTQGIQGYMYTREKFLKANLSKVQQIIRDQKLPGKMIFDTVEWGKVRPIIKGKFEQVFHRCKSWSSSWEHETIGTPLTVVISLVSAYVGANCLGPALINCANVANIPLACMAIKSSCSVICSKFITSLAVTGSFEKAFKSAFSKDTVICAATNCLLDYCFESFAKPLGIDLKSKDFIHCLKKQFLKVTLNSGVQAIKTGNINNLFKISVKSILSTALAESCAYAINQKFLFSQKIDYCINKALHGAVGIIEKLIKGGNIHSMFTSAVGAIISTVVIENLVKDYNVINQCNTSQNPHEQFQIQKLVAKICGGVAGGICCQNFQSALQAASNAVNMDFYEILQGKINLIMKNEEQFIKTKQILPSDGIEAIAASVAYYPNDQSSKQSPSDLYQAKKKGLQQHKNKFNHFDFTSFEVMHDFSDNYNLQKDFTVLKSAKQKKIVIGISGTRFNCGKDILDDIMIFFTGHSSPERFNQTKNFVEKIAKSHQDYQVILSGHSLGGHLAEHTYLECSKRYNNLSCTTFNSFHGFCNPIKENKITRFRMKHQFLFNHGMSNFIQGLSNLSDKYKNQNER